MDELRAFLVEQINGGFRVRELSRQTGVSASTISRVCSGQVAPDIETANKILHSFGYRLAINKIGMGPICHSPKPESPTNGDSLRSMSDEELAKELTRNPAIPCRGCEFYEDNLEICISPSDFLCVVEYAEALVRDRLRRPQT